MHSTERRLVAICLTLNLTLWLTLPVLTRFHKKKIIRKEVNLLSGGKDETAVEEKTTAAELEQERKDTPIVAHWHQNLTLALLTQRPEINLGATPAEVRECTFELGARCAGGF